MNTVTDEAEEATEPKEEGEETGQVMDEEEVPWDCFLLGESVISDLSMFLLSLLGSESSGPVCAESLSKSVRANLVVIPLTNGLGTFNGI